jgi:hypothetical protein
VLGEFVVFPSNETWVPGLVTDRVIAGHFLTTVQPTNLYDPATFEGYFDRVYADKGNLDSRGVLKAMANRWPNFREIERRFQIISEDQVTVIVPYGEAGLDAVSAFTRAEAGQRIGGLFEMLQGLTVSIFSKDAQPLIHAGVLVHLPRFNVYTLADASRYDPVYGLDTSVPATGLRPVPAPPGRQCHVPSST